MKKQIKAYNGESSPEIKKIWEDKVEEEERKFRKEIKKNDIILENVQYVEWKNIKLLKI